MQYYYFYDEELGYQSFSSYDISLNPNEKVIQFINNNLINIDRPIRGLCNSCNDNYLIENDGNCTPIKFENCSLKYMIDHYFYYNCQQFCQRNYYTLVILNIVDQNNEPNYITISEIYEELYYYNNPLVEGPLLELLPLCVNNSENSEQSNLKNCIIAEYVESENKFVCFLCFGGYFLNENTKECIQYDQQYNCQYENIGSKTNPIYSCKKCRSDYSYYYNNYYSNYYYYYIYDGYSDYDDDYYSSYYLLVQEGDIKYCVYKDSSIYNCLTANVDTTYSNNKYNCTSCEIYYLPIYSEYYGRYICQYIFDQIKTNQEIYPYYYQSDFRLEAVNGACPNNTFFTPDGTYCYECNSYAGMYGCKSKCSFSSERDDIIKCLDGCIDGYIETSEGICEPCSYITYGCSKCHYDNYPNDYLGIKRKRRFVCDQCQDNYVLYKGGCTFCSYIEYGCNKCQIENNQLKCIECSNSYSLNEDNHCIYCDYGVIYENNISKCKEFNYVEIEGCSYDYYDSELNKVVCSYCKEGYIKLQNDGTCLKILDNDKLIKQYECQEVYLEEGNYHCLKCKDYKSSVLKGNDESICVYLTELNGYMDNDYFDYSDLYRYEKNPDIDYIFKYFFSRNIYYRYFYKCNEVINIGTEDNPVYSCIQCENNDLFKEQNSKIGYCLSGYNIDNYYDVQNCKEKQLKLIGKQFKFTCLSCNGRHYIIEYDEINQINNCVYTEIPIIETTDMNIIYTTSYSLITTQNIAQTMIESSSYNQIIYESNTIDNFFIDNVNTTQIINYTEYVSDIKDNLTTDYNYSDNHNYTEILNISVDTTQIINYSEYESNINDNLIRDSNYLYNTSITEIINLNKDTTQLIYTTEIPNIVKSTTQIIYNTEILNITKNITQLIYNTEYESNTDENINDLLNDKNFLMEKNNTEILNLIQDNIRLIYNPEEGKSQIFKGGDNIVFQITNAKNELDLLKGGSLDNQSLSIIDLGQCEDKLKKEYHIKENDSLIYLKQENVNAKPSEKNIQYEVYEPYNFTKLNLSICEGEKINIYVKMEFSEETQKMYDDMKALGYDMLNINDPFYQDICAPFKSENNTDILLSDRIDYIYNNKDSQCQSNCDFSDYIPNSMYISCECSVVEEEEPKEEEFSGKKIFESFYEIFKYANFKILKCYGLVFNINVLKNNYGSIIILSIFTIYLSSLVFFIIKGISPLKNKIKDITPKLETKNDNQNDIIINKTKVENSINKSPNSKSKIFAHPVKKIIIKNIYNNNIKNNNININNNADTKRKTIKIKKKIKKINFFHESLKPYFVNNSGLNNIPYSSKYPIYYVGKFEKNEKIDNNLDTEKKKESIKFDPYELNNMEYDEAICYDQRTFLQIYWDLLSREHIIIFTFIICNDYNIAYIKYARFIFLFATDMAMNVFFFSDESMHKIFLNYGKYNFIQQIPQIVYTTIISQLIEVFLCYLSLTDKYIYQIKSFDESYNVNSILGILKCLKLKLVFFFIFTSIFFGFYWYTVAAFCAVYENTQITFLKDSLLSFLLGILYPIALYLIPASLRVCVLRHPKQNLKCIYKLSDVIPFF